MKFRRLKFENFVGIAIMCDSEWNRTGYLRWQICRLMTRRNCRKEWIFKNKSHKRSKSHTKDGFFFWQTDWLANYIFPPLNSHFFGKLFILRHQTDDSITCNFSHMCENIFIPAVLNCKVIKFFPHWRKMICLFANARERKREFFLWSLTHAKRNFLWWWRIVSVFVNNFNALSLSLSTLTHAKYAKNILFSFLLFFNRQQRIFHISEFFSRNAKFFY